MPVNTAWDAEASVQFRISFKVLRAFKALDDGQRRKWILVVRLQDLPANLPLDANARVPHVIKNRTCAEMRNTLLNQPELFQVFNGGIVCTADTLEIRQVESGMYADVTFDQSGGQGIINGGHSYATALHVGHDVIAYSDDRDLIAVLADDVRRGVSDAAPLVASSELLIERVAKAKQLACVQLEVVAPIPDSDLLAQVARARNLSQSVEATALANLAGKFDHLKKVLVDAFGSDFVRRVIWKTNQEVTDGATTIPVKLLLYILGLMNARTYQPGIRVPAEVFSRPGIITREYVEAEGEAEKFHQKLERSLPLLLELYDHIYRSISESDTAYPWVTGRLGEDVRHQAGRTPIFGSPCPSRVDRAFVWPVFAAFRQLLIIDQSNELHLLTDPFSLFDEKRQELLECVKSFHREQAHGMLQQVGRDRELWIRLEAKIEMELRWRKRDGSLGSPITCNPRFNILETSDLSQSDEIDESSAIPNDNGITGRRPRTLVFRGDRYSVNSWKDVYTTGATLLARMYPTHFESRAQEIPRTKFRRYRDGMRSPQAIPNTNLYVETHGSAADLMLRVKNLFKAFGHDEGEWSIESAARASR